MASKLKNFLNGELSSTESSDREAYDGDTFSEDGQSYRVKGADAPELGEPGGEVSRTVLQRLLDGDVEAEPTGRSSYDREEVELRSDGEDVATGLIQSGAARPTARYSNEDQIQAETSAFVRQQGNTGAQTEIDRAMIEAREQGGPRSNEQFLTGQTNGDFFEESVGSRAVDRGVANVKTMVGAGANFFGRKTDNEALADWGDDVIEQSMLEAAANPAEVESFQEADSLGEYGTRIYEALGEQLPTIGSYALGTATGGGLGLAAAGGLGKAFLKRSVTNAAKKRIMQQGGGAGAVAAGYPQHLGESWMTLREEGVSAEDTNAPFFTAAVNTALDVAPMAEYLRYSFKGLKPQMARDIVKSKADRLAQNGAFRSGVAGLAKGFAKGGSRTAMIEGATETAQEIVNLTALDYNDPTFSWNDEAVTNRILESAITGAVVGGAFGGAGRGASQAVGDSATARYLNRYAQNTEQRAETDQGNTAPEQNGESQDSGPADGRVRRTIRDFVQRGDTDDQILGRLNESQDAEVRRVFGGDTSANALANARREFEERATPSPATDREPDASVQAQLDELSNTGEQGRFRYFANAETQRAQRWPENLTALGAQDGGTYVFKNDDPLAQTRAQEAETAPDPDAARAEGLGYVDNKNTTGPNPDVVTSRDAEGNVVDQAAVRPENAFEQAARFQNRGGRVERQSPIEARAERAATLNAELEQQGQEQVQQSEPRPEQDIETSSVTLAAEDRFQTAARDARLQREAEQTQPEQAQPEQTMVSEGVPDPDGIREMNSDEAIGWLSLNENERETIRSEYSVSGRGVDAVRNLSALNQYGGVFEQSETTPTAQYTDGGQNQSSIEGGIDTEDSSLGEQFGQTGSFQSSETITEKVQVSLVRNGEPPSANQLDEANRNGRRVERLLKQALAVENVTMGNAVREGETGYSVEVTYPPTIFRDAEISPSVVEQVIRAAYSGALGNKEKGSAFELRVSKSKADGTSGSDPKKTVPMRMDPVAITKLGAVRLGLYGSGLRNQADIRAAFSYGLSYLQTQFGLRSELTNNPPQSPGEANPIIQQITNRRADGSRGETEQFTWHDVVGARSVFSNEVEQKVYADIRSRMPTDGGNLQGAQRDYENTLEALKVEYETDLLATRRTFGAVGAVKRLIRTIDNESDAFSTRSAKAVDRLAQQARMLNADNSTTSIINRARETAAKTRGGGQQVAAQLKRELNDHRAELNEELARGYTRDPQNPVLPNRAEEIAQGKMLAAQKRVNKVEELIDQDNDLPGELSDLPNYQDASERAEDPENIDTMGESRPVVGNEETDMSEPGMRKGATFTNRDNAIPDDSVAGESAQAFNADNARNPQVMRRYADAAQRLLKSLGIRPMRPVQILDAGNLEALRDRFADAEPGTDAAWNYALLDGAVKDAPTGRTLFLKQGEMTTPVIYIGPVAKNAALRDQVFVHEMAHVISQHLLQQQPTAVVEAMESLFGSRRNTVQFEENFANSFMAWVEERAQDEMSGVSTGTRNAIGTVIREVFKPLYRRLRDLWSKARKEFGFGRSADGQDTAESFREFMDYVMKRPAKSARTNLGKVLRETYGDSSIVAAGALRFDRGPQQELDFTKPDALSRSARLQNAKTWARKARAAAANGGETLRPLYERVYRAESSVVARIAGNGSKAAQRLQKATFRRSRTKENDSDGDGQTVFAEVRQEAEAANRELQDLLEYTDEQGKTRKHVEPSFAYHWLPFGGRLNRTEAYLEAEAALIDGRKPGDGFRSAEAERLYDGFVDFFRRQRIKLNTKGERIRALQGYTVPVAYSAAKVSQVGIEGIQARVRQWAQNPENRREVQAHFAGLRGDQTLEMRDPTESEVDSYGNALYETMTGLETNFDPQEQAEDFLSPGFASGKRRKIPDALRASLRDVRETDPLTLAYQYSTSGAKRGAFRRRFGLQRELARIDERFDRAREASSPDERRRLTQQANEYRDQTVQDYDQKYGVNIFDPMAGLRVELQKELNEGVLLRRDYEHLTEQTIPSYTGMLGSNMPQGLRNLSSTAISLMNMAILPLSVLAQLVDVGTTLAAMPPGSRMDMIRDLRKLANRGDREEMKRMAQFLGTWQDQATSHLLNDEVGEMQVSPKIQRMSEWFFRVNGMHAMTNYMRAWATDGAFNLMESYAKDFLDANVSEAEKQRYRETLKELNLTESDVIQWYRDRQANPGSRSDMDLGTSSRNRAVVAAAQELVDQAVVHPDPTIRPRMGNDQKLGVFFHLSGFIFGFAHRVIRRAWTQSVERFGETEGIRKITAAFPLLALAAFTMPMAAAGMELRWLIDPPQDKPTTGGADYMWEAFQRTGLLGLSEIALRMEEAEKYNRFSVLTPLGPTVTTFEQATKDGLMSGVESYIPGRPVIDFVAGWAWDDWRGQSE